MENSKKQKAKSKKQKAKSKKQKAKSKKQKAFYKLDFHRVIILILPMRS